VDAGDSRHIAAAKAEPGTGTTYEEAKNVAVKFSIAHDSGHRFSGTRPAHRLVCGR
jgi:hypothetical protein